MRPNITLTLGMMMAMGASAYAQTPAPTPTAPAPTPLPAISVPPNMPVTPAVPSATPIPGSTIVYKFVPGQDLKYAMTSSIQAKVKVGGKTIPMSEVMSADIDQVVKSVDTNGNGTITVSTSNTAITMNMAGQSIPIPKDQINKAPSSFTFSMTPRGSLSGFKMPPVPTAMPGEDISKFFDPRMFSNLAILPDHPVNVNDIWRGGFNLALFGVNIALKMTLNSISEINSNHVANIGIKFYAGINPDLSMFMPNKSAKHAPKVNGVIDGVGSMAFDIDNGYQKAGQADLSMTFSGSAPDNAYMHGMHGPNGMSGMPSSAKVMVNSSTNMKLVGVSMVDITTPDTPATPANVPALPAVQ